MDAPILRAAFRMLSDVGYSAMSVEAVAAEAGVGKTTIYRRYPTKRDLVIAVLQSLAPPPRLPDSADSRASVDAFVRQSLAAAGASSGVRVMGALLLEQRREPGLVAEFRRWILLPRKEALAEVLKSGAERGEIRDDVDLDVTLELIAGALIARHVLGGPVTDDWIASVSDAVWRSIARES